jgi:hypothetical protein
MYGVWGHPDVLYGCKKSGGATRGMPTLGRSQIQEPKYPEVLGRAIRHAPHMEAFIPMKNPGCPEQTGRAMIAHRPQKVTHPRCPTRLAGP